MEWFLSDMDLRHERVNYFYRHEAVLITFIYIKRTYL